MTSILEWLALTMLEASNEPRAPQRLYDEAERESKKLLAALPDEKKKLLENYENVLFAIDAETEKAGFIYGFRAAMAIMRECPSMGNKDGQLR